MDYLGGARRPSSLSDSRPTLVHATEDLHRYRDDECSVALHSHEPPEEGGERMALTRSAPGARRLDTMPPDVIELVAELVGYPDQVAMAAACKPTLQVLNSSLSYVQIHTLFLAATREIATVGRLVNSGYRNLQASRERWSEFTLGPSECPLDGPEGFRNEQRTISESINTHHARRAELIMALHGHLNAHVEQYLKTQAAPELRNFLLVCDRFLAAPDFACAKAIFDAELAADRMNAMSVKAQHYSTGLRQFFVGADDWQDMRKQVRQRCASERFGIASEMCKSWSIQIADMFRVGPRPADWIVRLRSPH